MNDLMKLALDDVRQRQKSLFDLILSTDRQAMTFFGFCVSICIASGTGAATALMTESKIPTGAGAALVCVSVGFLIAGFYCLETMKTVDIGLPGRRSEFWEWALKFNDENDSSVSEYIKEAGRIYDRNSATSDSMAKSLGNAKRAAGIALLLAAPAGLAVEYWAPIRETARLIFSPHP